MNLLEARTRLRSWLQEPDPTFYTNSELNEWLNSASFEATKDVNYPWKLWQEDLEADTAAYSMPSDFIRFHPLYNVYCRDDKLDKRDQKWLEHTYPSYREAESVEYPEIYYHDTPTTITLYPPPSTAVTDGLEGYYVYKETTMTNDAHTTLILTNYPYLALYRAILNAEIKQDDDTPKHRDLQYWEAKYLAEVQKVRAFLNRFIRGHGTRTVSPVEMD